MDQIIEKLNEIAAKAAAEIGAEVIHCERSGTRRESILRIFIDKDGGVTLDDCSKVSLAIESVLDVEDLIPGTYVLEVSSPGIERQLYSAGDFDKFAGRMAKVKFAAEVDGKKSVTGIIGTQAEGKLSVTAEDGKKIEFSFDQVAKANLKMDLGAELKGR